MHKVLQTKFGDKQADIRRVFIVKQRCEECSSATPCNLFSVVADSGGSRYRRLM